MVTLSPPAALSAEDGFPHGPRRLLLIGPPGTGKSTSALGVWMEPALRTGGAVLICSFGRRTVEDLRALAAKRGLLAASAARSSISTIHAEAYRRYAAGKNIYKLGRGLGLPSATEDRDDDAPTDAEASTSQEALRVRDPLVERFGERRAAAALRVYDFARQTCRVFEIESIARERFPEMAVDDVLAFMRAYEHYKQEHGAIDFVDLLQIAEQADDAQIPERTLLLVDEVQDCTELQFRVLERWAAKSEFFICIGDPDQSLYEFAGADGVRLARMAREGFAVRRLAKSFRVPRVPHQHAQRVIRGVPMRVAAPYEPADRAGTARTLSREEAIERAARAAAGNQSTMILARTRRGASAWYEELRARGVPAILETKSEDDEPERLDPELCSCIEAIVALREDRDPSPEALAALVRRLPVRKCAVRFFAERKRAMLVFDPGVTTRDAAARAGIDLRPIVRAESLAAAMAVTGLDRLLPREARDRARLGHGALDGTSIIRVTTYHRSKGREADLVMVDMKVPVLVLREAVKDRKVFDQERRALYVALTRTRDELVLVGSQYSEWLRGGR